MAYNTLSGTVEFSGQNGSLENTVRTDDFNQSIDGKKTFLQRVTASAITLNGSNLTAPAVTSVTNASANRVSFFNGAAGLEGNANLIFNAAGGLTSSYFSGSGRGLTNLRGDRFDTTISASSIKFGSGLMSDSNVLAVSGGAGIVVNAGGIKPSLDTNGGLNFNSTTLIVDPGQALDISNGGQSLASGDKFLVQDVAGASPAAPNVRSLTVGTLTSYLNSNLTFPTVAISTLNSAGANRVITSDGGSTATAEANLTFDASGLTVTGDITMNGANRILSGGVVRAASGAAVVNSRFAVGVQHDPAYDISVSSTASANIFVNGVTDANYLLGKGGTSYGGFTLLGAGDMKIANTQAGKDIIMEVNGASDLLRLTATGITSSANILLTGAAPHLHIGVATDTNGGMLNIRAKPNNNKVLILAQDVDFKPLFAVTGSGRVLVGGNYLEGRLNVSGSDSEKLITVKTDSVNPMFHVSRSAAAGGEMYISGSIVVRNTNPTLYFSNSAGDNLGSIGYNATNNILIQNDVTNKHIVFKTNDAGTTREGLRLDGAVPEVVVNQGSESLINFRVEGNTKQYLLYGEGSTDRVGVGTNNPTQLFTVGGDATISGTLGVSAKIEHAGDADTFIDFTNDDINIQAGGVNFIDITQDSTNEITFNEEGADIDFRVEGDSNTHLLYVDGGNNKVGIGTNNPTDLLTVNGTAAVSGSFRAKQLETTVHNFNNGGAAAFFVPFISTVEATTATYLNQFIAPSPGRLVKAFVRTANGQSGSVLLDVFIGTDGTTDFNGAGTNAERTSATMTARDTSYSFTTSGSNHFAGGDIVGIKLTPQSAVGNVNMTCIWEYDFLGT